VLAAAVKGPGGTDTLAEVRSAIGNVSAPWLLVGFVPGTTATRLRTGALLGLLATGAALLGFYVAMSFVVRRYEGDPVSDLLRALSVNKAYLEGGLVSGPVFGALGAWWRRTRSLRATVLAGALMVGEPLVLLALGVVFRDGITKLGGIALIRIIPGWGLGASDPPAIIAVYAVEAIAGIALAAVAWRRSRPEPPVAACALAGRL
jgi:hypothetical protein